MVIVEEAQHQPTIPPKRIKYQELVDNEEQDRIGALPDCLLLEILSRLLSTKDAIKTGTLSKRWKRLWTWVPNLLFQRYDSEQPWLHFGTYVYETLAKTHEQNLKKFELHTSFDSLYTSQVNYWIRYAISHNVQELNLRLWKTDTEVKCTLDRQIFTASCFTDLTLEGCILNPWGICWKKIPSGAITWKNLNRLCIFNEKIDEDLIKNILSGSPVLETLVLNRCYGYKQLNITSKSVKKLVFSGYMDPECRNDFAEIIKINAPNILSLAIRGGLLLWKLLLVNVSSLVEADLDYPFMGHWETTRNEAEEDMLKGFIQNLRHVKHLEIGVFCYKALTRLEAKGFDFPSNMKFPDVTLPTYSDNDSMELSDWSDSDSVTSGY